MQSVTFKAGDRILTEGEDGSTAYLIVSGTVEVSVGDGALAKALGRLGPGDVFGEMSLVEPGPRSASVTALTDTCCDMVGFDEFASADPVRAMEVSKTLVRRMRQTNQRVAKMNPELGNRIQQCLRVILSGFDAADAAALDMNALQRELHMLLQTDRLQVPRSELEKAEDVLRYMLRDDLEEGLTLWFGKSDKTDHEIWTRFGADVALASKGYFDHWALNLEHPRLLVALVIMLDQFPRNMYRDTPQMYACDPRCLALVKRALRIGVAQNLRPIERVFLCLVLTHSESLDDQLLCMEEWGRAMEVLAPDHPLNAFHEIFHRHVAVIKRFGRFPHRNKILERTSTVAEEDFLNHAEFRFDLPLKRGADGAIVFAGTVKKRTVKLLDYEYQTLLPDADEAPEGSFAFKYSGPDAAFTKTREQLQNQGFVRIGDAVPNFTADTSKGPVHFHDFIGDSWCVLFSHPADFTPVCTTEFGTTAKLRHEWAKRNTKVIGLSVDGLEEHERWIADINETQHADVDFPIIADKDRRISMLFGMLDPTHFRDGVHVGQTMTVRSVFIISPAKRVELTFTYPAYVGRSFHEILRVIDALQLTAKYHVATPANWQPGQDTVVLPFISDEEAERMFAEQGGFRKLRSYLRFVRDPSLRVL